LAGEAQVVALQRQVDGVPDRVGRDRDHDDDGRRAQQPSQPSLGPGALGELPADRLCFGRRLGSCDRRAGGAHGTSPFDTSASFSWLATFFSVLWGVMLAGGDTAWEITMERFW